MEDFIVHTALAKLKEIADITGTWNDNIPYNQVNNTIKDIDGIVEINIMDEKTTFFTEIKKELRNYQLPGIFDKAKKYERFLLIAENIFPKIKEQLREKNIGYLDTKGNIYIKTDKNLIWIEHGKQLTKEKKIPNRAFTKIGIKVLFLYLLDQEWLNRPYREIAENAGVALGTVPPVIAGLKELGYLVKVDKKRLRLIKKEELLNKWAEAYGEKLKPKIKVGNFMQDTKSMNNWREINFNDDKTLWGGEPAADLLTNYLNPEKFTLYTARNTKELIINFHLLPHKNGQIAVYEKFWKLTGGNQKTVPPLLVYADLINTGDSRCIETAKIIYDRYLRENL